MLTLEDPKEDNVAARFRRVSRNFFSALLSAFLTACSTLELFSSEKRFAKLFKRDSITCVKFWVKEAIESATVDLIADAVAESRVSILGQRVLVRCSKNSVKKRSVVR